MLEKLINAVVNGDEKKVVDLTEILVKRGISPNEIISNGLAQGMKILGEKFEKGEVFLAELLVSAEAVSQSVKVLRPFLKKEDATPRKKVVIATIEGDIHTIGKDIVRMVLEANGFEVIDLGADVPAKKIAEAAKKHEAEIVAVSALLSTTMLGLKEVPKALEEEGIRKRVKIIFGGAPVTEEFSKRCGGDLYAGDAFEALEILKKVTGA